MSNHVNRRTLFKGAAAGALAVGFSQAAGGWLTAAAAAGRTDVAWAPPFDGHLETAPEVLESFSHDFGRLTTPGTPRAVLRPGSVDDIVKAVRFTRQNRLTIAMNGQSGTGTDLESHSNYGQAAVPDGISIDARELNQIHQIDADSAVVDAGVTWAELAQATLAHGKTPPALPDYLHLTVGGTISVGGIGGTVHQHGLLCDTVDEIEIVTGTGRLLTASLSRNPALFLAALGGGGQVGLIVRARVKLVPAKPNIIVFNLFYNDLAAYCADAEKLAHEGRFDHQSGEIVRTLDDTSWRYKVEAGVYFDGDPPDQEHLLRGLNDEQAEREVAQMPYAQWIFRIDPYEDFLKDNGFWEQPKPWFSMVLPATRTQQYISAVVDELVPEDLGAGFAGFYPFPVSKLTRPMFAKPIQRTAYLFDLLRFPVPGDPGIDRMMDQNRRLYDLGVSLGGKRYLVGAIPDMTTSDWRRHFGLLWPGFRAAKFVYDPANILTPGQGFFS
ncbi:FAD-binding protein [Natronosporangium hydrolyticum]|uniref:FAD-binding protein n=1 Tax=Natronosporangium hydrolyticum TaxID=2811111 RepID=A0A895YFY0_9ACTN|nr:FAD-binding protein [Natronosporangium hydrolyticum]QSB16774.1 FAD-binding protein [Natronosporangium hydrolyticum]